MRILVYDKNPQRYVEALREAGVEDEITAADDAQEAREAMGETEVLLGWQVPPGLLSRAPRLRWIQSTGVGIDDIVRSPIPPTVTVTHVLAEHYGREITQYVFAELLYRVRDLHRVRRLQAERSWEPFLTGTLAGQKLGVAGLGAIGSEIARVGRAFHMEITGLSRTGDGRGVVERAYTPRDWIPFVSDLDVLVLILPLTRETRHQVDASVLSAMKPSSLLVNVGRGAVVDEAALVEALRAGRPAGAILDVFETEPLPRESPLWNLPGVTLEPHMAGPSHVDEVTAFFVKNLERYRTGEPLLGRVDLSRQY